MASTVSERLQNFLASRNLSAAQVSRDTGIQYDTLQQILSGKVKAMGVDKFAAIWKTYPDLDAWYILTGEQRAVNGQQAMLSTIEELQAFRDSLNKRIEELGQQPI